MSCFAGVPNDIFTLLTELLRQPAPLIDVKLNKNLRKAIKQQRSLLPLTPTPKQLTQLHVACPHLLVPDIFPTFAQSAWHGQIKQSSDQTHTHGRATYHCDHQCCLYFASDQAIQGHDTQAMVVDGKVWHHRIIMIQDAQKPSVFYPLGWFQADDFAGYRKADELLQTNWARLYPAHLANQGNQTATGSFAVPCDGGSHQQGLPSPASILPSRQGHVVGPNWAAARQLATGQSASSSQATASRSLDDPASQKPQQRPPPTCYQLQTPVVEAAQSTSHFEAPADAVRPAGTPVSTVPMDVQASDKNEATDVSRADMSKS